MSKKIYGTKSQLARILGCDVRSAAIANRQPDSYLSAGNKTVGVYELGLAATDEQERELQELRKLTGLARTTRARKLEARFGKGWELLCSGEAASKPAAPAKVANKPAVRKPLDQAIRSFSNAVRPDGVAKPADRANLNFAKMEIPHGIVTTGFRKI